MFLSDQDVWCMYGVHPHYSNEYHKVKATLVELLKRDRVVALGEIGLDYGPNNHVGVHIQKTTFKLQIALAIEKGLSLCLHIRQAHKDGLLVLEESKLPADYRIHLHCFNSNWAECQEWVTKYPNLKVGFTPMITNSENKHLHEVIRNIPLNRILLETDAPYFLPFRGASASGLSHPGFVSFVAKEIASLKNVSVEEVILANRRNVQEIYGI